MAAIKSFTSLEQSRKLAKILPLESSDMCWIKLDDDESFDGSWEVVPRNSSLVAIDDKPLFCWSLAALLSVLHDYTLQTNMNETVFVVCESKKPMVSGSYDNPVDACVEMIIKLNEFNLL